MGKCLITKLAGTVNDESLLKVGEFSIDFTVNKKSSGFFCSAGKITIDGNPSNSISNVEQGNHTLKVQNKYKEFLIGTKDGSVTFDFSTMKGSYMSNITELVNTNDITYEHYNTFKGDTSDISKLSNLKLVELNLCNDITGKMEDFSSCVNLESLQCPSLKKITLTDPSVFSNCKKIKKISTCYTASNIENFANCLLLEELAVKYCPAEGKIDTLARLMHTNGRKSGTLKVICGYTNITCDAVSKEQQSESYYFVITFSDSGYSIA